MFSFYFETPVSAELNRIGKETHYGIEQDFLVGNSWYQYVKFTDIVINNKTYVVKLSKTNQGKMVLNAAELVSMESILFLSAMFQACQFQFSPIEIQPHNADTHRHTHTETQMYQGL